MNLTKQYEIPQIGSLVHLTYQTLPMLSIVSNIMGAITMFGVWRPGIMSWFPWFSLPIFLLCLAGLALFLMYLNRTLIYRGYYRFQNEQQFAEDSPVMKQIRKAVREEVRAELLALKEKVHD